MSEGRAKADAMARRRDRRNGSLSPSRIRSRSSVDRFHGDRHGGRERSYDRERDADRRGRRDRDRDRRDRSRSGSLNRPTLATGPMLPPPPPARQSSVRERGVVARWFDKGYGFIVPEGGGEEIFVHNTDIHDGEMLEAGAPVEFVRGSDEAKDGKARAQQVTGGCYPSKSQYVWGTVVRWGEDKGYGFVTEDDGDGEQIFCHDSAIIVGRPLLPTARVQFVKVWDPNKGKHRAEQVRGEPVEDPLMAMAMAPLKRPKGDSSGDPDTPRQGDWTCPVCEANVFATKLNCYRCQTPKEALLDPTIISAQAGLRYGPAGTPVAGFGAGGGYDNDPRATKKGLETKIPPRPGDWTCPMCNLNVFASKSNCFRCNTPKPSVGGLQPTAAPKPKPAQAAAGHAPHAQPHTEAKQPRTRLQELEALRRRNASLRRRIERERLVQDNAALRQKIAAHPQPGTRQSDAVATLKPAQEQPHAQPHAQPKGHPQIEATHPAAFTDSRSDTNAADAKGESIAASTPKAGI